MKSQSSQGSIDELLNIMRMLRDPQHGCPWDIEQDFRSIAAHTVEEAYEVLDCIEREDYAHLPNELGDLLFQVVFYAQMGKEAGLFDFYDICRQIADKLLSRHPHVFPDGKPDSFGRKNALTPAEVESKWEMLKQQEREARSGDNRHNSVLEDVPLALPALRRAVKLQKRAATVGFDWTDVGSVLAKVREEQAELAEAMQGNDQQAVEDEFGDLLFSIINLSRHLKVDAEASLRRANSKFESRFRKLEMLAADRGLETNQLTVDELESLWQEVKYSGSDKAER